MVRTVQTAHTVATQLGLGENSICVEMGLVEEAKSFRGKTASEPRPNWNPLVLPLEELLKYSNLIDANYQSLKQVSHVKDDSVPNTVRESHEHLLDRDEVTKDRCRQTLEAILTCGRFVNDDILLLVGHGATVGAMLKCFEKELMPDDKIKGEKSVSCYSEFHPVEENNLMGPWKSVSGVWLSGNIGSLKGAEDLTDRGLSAEIKP
jgi:hypothetical protein